MDPRDSGREPVPEEAGLWEVLNRERPFDAPIEKKKDSLKRYADNYIHSGWQA